MTFNPNADVSNTRAKRRGGGAAKVGGGVGIVGVLVLLFSMFSGTDLTGLIPGLTGGGAASDGSGSESSLDSCLTGADANEDDACRVAAITLALDAYWDEQMEGYRAPTPIIVDGATQSACGTASNAVGPFYCPSDEGIYVDPTFFDLLRQQYGASAQQLAQVYIVAHEWGHHIQNITGIMGKYPNNGTGAASNGVRIELQADCFAGAFIGEMTETYDANGQPYLIAPTETELRDALNAAAAVGDDHIQQMSGMRVNPESFSHGSSEQRQRWFATGYQNGVGSCDTFNVSGSNL
ncbi:hypothetical protein SAMN06298212_11064 [Ruaniaceae bacterium KH17]|nr:hypothetical protein SAMN06298212_11064 [Ruaniaceae bacterium KH17]